MTYGVTSFDALQKCDNFLLLSAECFPTIYNMNGLAALIFSRYCTLKDENDNSLCN